MRQFKINGVQATSAMGSTNQESASGTSRSRQTMTTPSATASANQGSTRSLHEEKRESDKLKLDSSVEKEPGDPRG